MQKNKRIEMTVLQIGSKIVTGRCICLNLNVLLNNYTLYVSSVMLCLDNTDSFKCNLLFCNNHFGFYFQSAGFIQERGGGAWIVG